MYSKWIWLQCMISLVHVICHLVTCIPIVQDLRLTLENEISGYNNYEHEGPGTYAFGYDIDDLETQNTQFREEERHRNGTVTGSYGWVASDGNVYLVRYIADTQGYRANMENMANYNIYRRRNPSILIKNLRS